MIVQFIRSDLSDSLRPHGLQHASLPCPSPIHGACSNSCPLSQWCHPTISSSVIPFSFCLQFSPALESFPMSQFFASGGQSIGVSASAWVLPMNIQGWFPLGLTGLIKLRFRKIMSLLCIHTNIDVMNGLRNFQSSFPSRVWLSWGFLSISCQVFCELWCCCFLDLLRRYQWKVFRKQPGHTFLLRWIFSSLLTVILRCSSGLILIPGVTTESAQTLAMISVNQQLKVKSRCAQFQYGKKCKNVLLRMDWNMVLSHPTYPFLCCPLVSLFTRPLNWWMYLILLGLIETFRSRNLWKMCRW